MACTPPYFGYCCEPPIRAVLVRQTNIQRGFISADRSELQQFYQFAESFTVWNFTTFGNTYSGSRSVLGVLDEGSSSPRFDYVGDALPDVGFPVLEAIVTAASATVLEGTLVGKASGEDDNQIREVGTWRYSVDGALQTAHGASLDAVLAYLPATGANPLGATVTDLGDLPQIASLNGGTFRPGSTALPRRVVGSRGFVSFLGPIVGFDTRAISDGTAARIILPPDPASLIRLRSYTRGEFDTSPITYLDCVTVDGAGGLDVVPTVIPDGKTAVGIEVTKWSKTGPSPC